MSNKDSKCANIIDRPDFNQPKDLFYPDWSICKTEEGFRQWLKEKPKKINEAPINEDPINEVLDERLELSEKEVAELVEQYLSTDITYNLSEYNFHASAVLYSNGIVGAHAHKDQLNYYGVANLLRNGTVIDTQKFQYHKGYGVLMNAAGSHIGDVFFDLPRDIISGEIIEMQIITSAEYIATGLGPSLISENIIFDLPYFIEISYEDI